MGKISSKSPINLTRKTKNIVPKLFFVATEGQETETQYLNFYANVKSNVIVVPIPCSQNRSSAQNVVDNLKDFIKNRGILGKENKYDFKDYDEFWIMIDTDHQIKKGHIRSFKKAIKEANDAEFKLAISNPSIEVWFYTHFEKIVPDDLNQKSSYFEEKLKVIPILDGYNKSNIHGKHFQENLKNAIEENRKLDIVPTDRWPQTTCSRIYRLMENFI